MKKTIIVTLVILMIITAFAAAAFTVVHEFNSSNEQEKNVDILQDEKIDDFNVDIEDDLQVNEDILTDSEVDIDESNLNEISNYDTDNAKKTDERIEVKRTRYEDCGYGTAYYVIEYSDGSSEIVDE